MLSYFLASSLFFLIGNFYFDFFSRSQAESIFLVQAESVKVSNVVNPMFLSQKKGVSLMQQLPIRFALACAVFTGFAFTLLAQGPTEFFQGHEVSAHEVLVK